MAVSRAAAERRLQAAGYTQRTIATILGSETGPRVRVNRAAGNVGRGSADVARILRGQAPVRRGRTIK